MEKWRFRMEIYLMIRRGSEHRCTYICTMIFTVLLGLRAVCESDCVETEKEEKIGAGVLLPTPQTPMP